MADRIATDAEVDAYRRMLARYHADEKNFMPAGIDFLSALLARLAAAERVVEAARRMVIDERAEIGMVHLDAAEAIPLADALADYDAARKDAGDA